VNITDCLVSTGLGYIPSCKEKTLTAHRMGVLREFPPLDVGEGKKDLRKLRTYKISAGYPNPGKRRGGEGLHTYSKF
jgi:hypothetical protein